MLRSVKFSSVPSIEATTFLPTNSLKLRDVLMYIVVSLVTNIKLPLASSSDLHRVPSSVLTGLFTALFAVFSPTGNLRSGFWSLLLWLSQIKVTATTPIIMT